MTNEKISAALTQLADLLEFQGTNPFRLRAYRNAARVIEELPESIASMIERGDDLTKIEGIGKAVAEKSHQLVETGRLRQLDEILEQIPKSVLDLLRIPKLGPKKAAVLFNELGIKTLEQLQDACEADEVQALAGFGKKTQQAILDGIQIAGAANQRIYWSAADKLVNELREHFDYCDEIDQLEFAGSYRRGKETVGDLDILVASGEPAAVMDRFAEFPNISEQIGRGPTKMSVRLDSGFQIDLRVVPERSFGAALQYFTGSKDHNVKLRGMAKDRGLKINEWGVFRIKGDEETYVAGETEADVYAAMELPVYPPEIRESRGEFDLASDKLPKLITVDDIRGDLHMHTDATDGKATLEEMVAAAKKRGLKYIAITDHSQRVTMARGLDPKRLREQWKQIDRINDELGSSFHVLKGIECDILEDGQMDLPDDVLADADWVLASIHYGQDQERRRITDRIVGALRNPNVSCIAHPTGRLLNRRRPYDVDMDAVFAAAKEHKKMLELNANPARLDLNDVHCARAKSLGIPIAISTDAHSVDGLNVMKYGIKQARRGGLTAKDVANTMTLKQLGKLLNRQ